MVKYTGRGLVVKRPGVLRACGPDAESCLGGGVLFPSSNHFLRFGLPVPLLKKENL